MQSYITEVCHSTSKGCKLQNIRRTLCIFNFLQIVKITIQSTSYTCFRCITKLFEEIYSYGAIDYFISNNLMRIFILLIDFSEIVELNIALSMCLFLRTLNISLPKFLFLKMNCYQAESNTTRI